VRCSDIQELLPHYADDALPAGEQQQITAHLEGCAECAAELDGFDRALGALNAVAPTAAPDLWSQFQARLALEQAGVGCLQVVEMLPAYAEQALEEGDDRLVSAHLTGCETCAREHAVYARSSRALAGAARQEAPDLWPALAAQLGAGMACGRARELVFSGGEAQGEEAILDLHLRACAGCTAHAAGYQQAISALERAGARVPQVDLWPAFAARLKQQDARTPGAALAAFWVRLWHQPAFRPALGMGAVVLITLAANSLLPGRPASGPQAARPAQIAAPAIASSALPADKDPETREAAQPVKRKPAARRKPVRKQPRRVKPRAPRSGGPVILRRPVMARAVPPTPRPERRSPTAEEIRMALARPVTPEPVPVTAESAPLPEARQEMVAEVVHAFEMLAGAEDAAKQPFGVESFSNAP
jgi:hypothetical protein